MISSPNFFLPEEKHRFHLRLNNLTESSDAKWGTMTPAQMLHHLNLSIGCGLGVYRLEDKSNLLSRTLIKWIALYILKRFPKGSETAPTLKVESSDSFDQEKETLKKILSKAYQTSSDSDWKPHTYFGTLTRNEWGRLIAIHLNHHFTQFSV